jgi:ankyrin repeat protein
MKKLMKRLVTSAAIALFATMVSATTNAAASDPMLNRALREEARLGRLNGVERLVRAGARINSRAEFGETALHYAVQFGHVPTVRRLIALGANPNVQDEYGNSPLLLASSGCNDLAVETLLKAGASVTHSDRNGRNALMNAAESSCVRVAALILSHVRGTPALQALIEAQDHRFKAARDYATHPWIEDLLEIARDTPEVKAEPLSRIP